MKKLKFSEPLPALILRGEKTTTWRLFDDRDLSVGDLLEFERSETKDIFARAKIVDVLETTFGSLSDDHWSGHEKFANKAEMLETYARYYNCKVSDQTALRVVKFELLEQ